MIKGKKIPGFSAALSGKIAVAAEKSVEVAFCTRQKSFVDAIANLYAFDIAFDKAGILERFQVLRNGALREGQLVYNIAANAGLFLYQQFHNGHARRMRQSFGELGQLVVLLRKCF